METSPQIIEFNDVCVSIKGRAIVENLSFIAKPGEITGLLGRNGAGKTTALRTLTEFISPQSGVALIGGKKFSDRTMGEVGVLLNAQFPSMRKVIDQLKISACAARLGNESIERIIHTLELEKFIQKRIHSLSQGMKQRLGIACALISDPTYIVLDEPVNGLDPDGIYWLHTFLKSQAARGKTVLVSSHYLHDIENYVESVVIIQNRVIWSGDWKGRSRGELAEHFAHVTSGLKIE